MHNIDRTIGEMEFGFENEFGQETGYENEFGQEMGYEYTGENEFGQEFAGENEYSQEFGYETGELHEALEMELATELLEVSNEAELEQFLGKLIRGAAKGVRNFANSAAGKALGGVLKSVAKKALPMVGSALGGVVGGPAGAMIGGKLAGMAGKAFGLELEGLSAEDKELEISRAYVRFANNAVQRAARSRRSRYQPRTVARSSVVAAARRYAPGLLSMPSFNLYQNGNPNQDSYDSNGYNEPSQSGRWVRRGNTIVIYGV